MHFLSWVHIIEHIIGIIYIPKTGIHILRDHSQNITKYSNYKPISISHRRLAVRLFEPKYRVNILQPEKFWL